VAFDRLLADGEQFFRRLSGAAGPGLLALATDGETYGHHFTFGEWPWPTCWTKRVTAATA
jgi:hypothetical protein